MTRAAGFVLVLGLAISEAHAQGIDVRMTTDKAVYKVGSSDPVKITFTNLGNTPIYTEPQILKVVKLGPTPLESPIVFESSSAYEAGALPPGKSLTAKWFKKDSAGNPVPAGSYKIVLGGLKYYSGGAPYSFDAKHAVAVTPTGKIAGNVLFPLALSNSWEFVSSSGALQDMDVSTKDTQGLYKVWYLFGGMRWAVWINTVTPVLAVKTPTGLRQLFRFNRPLGHMFSVNVPDFGPKVLKVGSVNTTVTTPAGTFTGCYRLDVVTPPPMVGGYGSFWFAPGTGPVQFTQKWGGVLQTFRIRSAHLRGSDGKIYRFQAYHN